MHSIIFLNWQIYLSVSVYENVCILYDEETSYPYSNNVAFTLEWWPMMPMLPDDDKSRTPLLPKDAEHTNDAYADEWWTNGLPITYD